MNVFIKKYHINIVQFIFVLSLICIGVFHEYCSCAFSVCIFAYFIWNIHKGQQLKFHWNLTSISIIMLVALYGVSMIWAIDAGMAFVGMLKFLPVLLFLILLYQNKGSGERVITSLPYVAAVLTLLSIVGMYIPIMESQFSVAGRLAGFFQYPNAYALFLLVAELVLFQKVKYKAYDYASFLILGVGILWTGSRSVFVFAILANGFMIFMNRNKKLKIVGLIGLILILVGISVYVLAFDGADVIGRFLKISFHESTFVGRILYYVDAVPIILKSPFGLGYLGYYYMQPSIQTGLYSVRYIHNDFLQIMLDIGWIPSVLLLAAIIKSIFNKNTTLYKRVILVVMLLHSCFDFNLQFVAIFCLLLLFMNYEDGLEIICKKKGKVLQGAFLITSLVCMYCGIALAFGQANKYDLALKLYPWNTSVATMYLTELDDIEEAGSVADQILKQNEYATLAYSAKARQAYAKGDFGQMILYKNEVLKKAPYLYEEYEDYCYMLINGIKLYTNAGDLDSANVCKQELLAVPDKLEEAKCNLSKLGKKIKDQPITELPDNIMQYISKLEGVQ